VLGVLLFLLLAAAPAAAARVRGTEPRPAGHAGRECRGGTVSIFDARSFKVLRTIDVLPDGDPLDSPETRVLVEIAGANYAQDQDLSRDVSPPYRRILHAPAARSPGGQRVEARIRTTGARLLRSGHVPGCSVG
jgi:hypothetical protein